MRALPRSPAKILARHLFFSALVLALSFGTTRAQLIPGSGTGLSVDANTVGLFHFDDPATTALDSTSNNRDATVTGTTADTGLFGSSRSFNGTSDRLEFGSVFNALTGSSAWTIEYFAKSGNGSAAPYLMSGNDHSGFYFAPADGSVTYGIKTTSVGDSSWLFLTSVTAPAMDTAWHYYALTWTSGGALSVYRDGILLGGSATSGSWSGSNNYGLNLDYDPYAGGSYGGAGFVDDLRFSNIARTPTEIQNAYNLAAIPEPSTYAALAGLGALGLTMWWRRAGQRAV